MATRFSPTTYVPSSRFGPTEYAPSSSAMAKYTKFYFSTTIALSAATTVAVIAVVLILAHFAQGASVSTHSQSAFEALTSFWHGFWHF